MVFAGAALDRGPLSSDAREGARRLALQLHPASTWRDHALAQTQRQKAEDFGFVGLNNKREIELTPVDTFQDAGKLPFCSKREG